MGRFHLPPDWQVPDLFARRLGDAAGRQRAMAADGHLLLILHAPPASGDPDRAGRAFWRDPAGEWRAKGLGDGPQALARHLTEFADRADELDEELQAAQTAADYYALLRGLAPLHRTARNLHAVLQEARELAPADRHLINARDRAGEIERAVELLYADARGGLDYTIAREAERQAERTYNLAVAAHRLNLLAAVFFPVVTLGAVFGMNLTHGLDRWATPAHFWALLGLGLATGLALARLIARPPARL